MCSTYTGLPNSEASTTSQSGFGNENKQREGAWTAAFLHFTCYSWRRTGNRLFGMMGMHIWQNDHRTLDDSTYGKSSIACAFYCLWCWCRCRTKRTLTGPGQDLLDRGWKRSDRCSSTVLTCFSSLPKTCAPQEAPERLRTTTFLLVDNEERETIDFRNCNQRLLDF